MTLCTLNVFVILIDVLTNYTEISYNVYMLKRVFSLIIDNYNDIMYDRKNNIIMPSGLTSKHLE